MLVGNAIASNTKEGKASRKLLLADIEQLKSGRFGLTEGQKSQMVNQAAQDIQAQTAPAVDEAQRMTAAQGGVGRSGYSFAAMSDIAKARANAIAQARGQVDALSQQKAEADYLRARANVEMAAGARKQLYQQTGSSIGGGQQVQSSSTQYGSWSNYQAANQGGGGDSGEGYNQAIEGMFSGGGEGK